MKSAKLAMRRLKAVSDDKKYFQYGLIPKLSTLEKQEIHETWPFWKLTDRDMVWVRIFKKFNGFSPYAIGVWQSVMLREALNPYNQLSAFENKSMCDIYFPSISFPTPLVRRIGGIYYDIDMRVLCMEEVVRILKKEQSYIIKPAFGTMQGCGVQKVVLGKGNDEEIVKESIKKQPKDFIAQKVLRQHPLIESLNPTSLNCCRVTSIYINGRYDYSVMLKIGKKGSSVDNWNSSILCGVSKDGILADIAYDNHLNVVRTTDNGRQFGGMRLPKFEEMLAYVEDRHKMLFPNCGVIGWDICIDLQDQVRVIETNITEPGLVGEQLVSGDFFRPFHDDLCAIMSKSR